jgi:hypothetical protein
MALSPQALIRGIIQKALPSRNNDSANVDVAMRQFTYGEMAVQSLVRKAHNLADEGTYFVANNNQTGILMQPSTAFAATLPSIVIQNNAPVSSGIQAYIDYINLTVTTAGVVTTTQAYEAATVVLDNGLRYTSGGTVMPLYNSPNMNNATTKSVCQAYAGVITATAASAVARTIVGQRILRPFLSTTVPDVVGDQIILNFGGVEQASNGQISITASVANIIPIPMPPLIIGPQQSALVYLYFPTATVTSAPSMTVEIGQWER